MNFVFRFSVNFVSLRANSIVVTMIHPPTSSMPNRSTNRIGSHYCLVVLWAFLTIFAEQCSGASFYGLSYMKLPLHETKNSTELELRFKTHQENAFLFLAAGSADYCLVYLENGQIAVKINFGSSETYLSSHLSRPLNDLLWHQIKLKVIKSHLALTIDEQHQFLQRIKGDSLELRIKYGVFLGGQDNFKSLYLGSLRSFRGCIDHAVFNRKDVLDAARTNGIVHNVGHDCDEQFSIATATADNIVSFIEDDSFVILSNLFGSPKNLTKISFHFEVKTISEVAVLLFGATSNSNKRQYIALEVINGKVKFSSNDRVTELRVHSPISINDGHWHQVDATISSNGLQVSVDGRVTSISSGTNGQKLLINEQRQCLEELLLGGLSTTKQSIGLNVGLQSAYLQQNVSLKGCIRNMRVNRRAVNLSDALATNRIKSGKCRWNFLCTAADQTKSPCIDEAECEQRTINKIECTCESDGSCITPLFKHKTVAIVSKKVFYCKRHLKPLQIFESNKPLAVGKSIIREIDVTNDEQYSNYHAHNYNQNIKFRLKIGPKYGTLLIDDGITDWFEWSIVENLLYMYNVSSQKYNDTVVLQMHRKSPEVNDATVSTPVFANEGHEKCERTQLILPIKISPAANDAPSPKTQRNVIRIKMIKNSKKILDHNLFKRWYNGQKLTFKSKIKDELLSKLLYYRVGKMKNGGLSRLEKIDKWTNQTSTINEFSENDLESRTIRFAHVADLTNPELPVEITLHPIVQLDQSMEKVESELRISIEIYEIELMQVANSGLLLAHNTMAMINNANLSFAIGNATQTTIKQESGQIKYDIISGPEFGTIQKLRSTANQWTNATHFSQRQIDRGKLRYVHLIDRPKRDKVQLNVSFNRQLTHTLTLMINFVDQLRIVSIGSNQDNLITQEKEVLINSHKLCYITEPVHIHESKILITLLSAPTCGELYLSKSGGRQNKLQISSSFTQKDINDEKLSYVRNHSRPCLKANQDLFDFEVSIVDSNQTQMATFNFYFEPGTHKYELINNKVTVIEGEKVVIDQNSLSFVVQNDQDIVFRITKQPKHGLIQQLSVNQRDIERESPNQISQKLIKERRIIYVHDDSENDADMLDFAVVNNTDHELATGRFFIQVSMKNDNAPVRLIDRPFNVIRSGERAVLDSDLKYVDADINTATTSIIYTVTLSPNGNFFFRNGTVADRFSQANIDQQDILFRHDGNDLGKAILWVSDGQFYMSCALEIRAANPYITVTNLTDVWVKYGENVFFSAANFPLDTNLDLSNKSNVIFKINSEPKYGQILLNEKVPTQFTYEDISSEMLEYESTVFEDELPLSKNDSFSFRILLNRFSQATSTLNSETYEFNIRIYPQSYFNINLIKKNSTVFEEKSVIINASNLLAEHSELKPEHIVYRVVEPPRYGVIQIGNMRSLSELAQRDRQGLSFTQQDINNGNVEYQNKKFENDLYAQFWDTFVFDVGEDVVTLSNQTFYIEIIPKLITLITGNITVEEGQSVTLSEKNLSIAQPYYEKVVDEFVVIEKPKFGSISFETPAGIRIAAKSFTLPQLKYGKISYKQDSSEVDHDWFTVVARSNSLEKESLPATVHVTINSVNDESPKIVNNTAIWVWQNANVQIASSNLAAVDEDTASAGVAYTTYMPNNGYLINIDTNTTVDSFTQEDIDAGRIYFVHVGSEDASFRFHVSDGINHGVTSVFNINVQRRSIQVANNERLFVAPGMIQSITKQHLLVHTNADEDDQERNYTYRVMKSPTYGRIVLELSDSKQESPVKVFHFSQQQIDQNLVLYEQDVPLSSTDTVTDRIVLNVESVGLPTLENIHFLIEISREISIINGASANGMHNLMHIVPLTVEEGKFGTFAFGEANLKQLILDKTYIDNMCLKIDIAPMHGLILKSGVKISSKKECIVARAFTNRSVVYMHDNSNTFEDSVTFKLAVFDDAANQKSLKNLTVPIKIIPVNDEFPVVINRNPTLKAVYASKTPISNQTLNARDDDRFSSIIYQIRRDGNHSRESYFILQPRDAPIYEFTQDDIDSNRIYFNHRGQVMQFTYWFRVKDHPSVQCKDHDDENLGSISGAELYEPPTIKSSSHCSAYYPLRIIVSQLTLQLQNHSNIQLPQATFRVSILESNLGTISKSTSPNFIFYKITKGPFHGYVSVEGGVMHRNEFNQKQVNDHLVQYVQTNMSAEDYFLVDIENGNSNEKSIYDVNVKIVTTPLINAQRPFLAAFSGQQALLNYEYLDASELALKTNSNPVFKIITPPRYGYFKLMQFGEQTTEVEHQQLTNEVIKSQNEFTQEDIIRNRIAYVAQSNLDLSYLNEMLTDVIHYKLGAANVQDAHGILVVNVFNNRSSLDGATLTTTKTNYLHKIDIKLSKEVVFAILTIAVSFVLVVCLYAIARACGKRDNHLHHLCTEHDAVKSLPRNENVERCDGRHCSSSSLRQTECSSHTSSNSALACAIQQTSHHHHHVPYELPLIGERHRTESIIARRSVDSLSEAHMSPTLTRPANKGHTFSDKSEEISPLPPPSLYFINDCSFEDQQSVWDKFHTTPRFDESITHSASQRSVLAKETDATRSSGDGTSSYSNSPQQQATTIANYKSNPYDQLTHLEEYLNKFGSFGDDDTPSHGNITPKSKPSQRAQMRNPYWI